MSKVNMEKQNVEEQQESERKVNLPEWAPVAIIRGTVAGLSLCGVWVLYVVICGMLALHEAPTPWWVTLCVYTFVAGMLYRAAKERKIWKNAIVLRWGIYTRWVQSLA